MRDQTIINLVKGAVENSHKDLETRITLLEGFISDIMLQVAGTIILLNSIPVAGKIISRMIERNAKKYQKVIHKKSVEMYQQQKKKEAKNRELAGNIKQG